MLRQPRRRGTSRKVDQHHKEIEQNHEQHHNHYETVRCRGMRICANEKYIELEASREILVRSTVTDQRLDSQFNRAADIPPDSLKFKVTRLGCCRAALALSMGR